MIAMVAVLAAASGRGLSVNDHRRAHSSRIAARRVSLIVSLSPAFLTIRRAAAKN